MDGELLTLGRAARRIGVTQAWLRREAEEGRVPCLRADKRLLFEVEALQRALRGRAAVETAGEPTR
jgi:hypothetical protein